MTGRLDRAIHSIFPVWQCCGRLCRAPRYGALTDIEQPRQVCLGRRSGGTSFQRVVLLVRGELRRSPHMNTARLGALVGFAGVRGDQFALELRRL
jgi:hypothetical protein